LYSAPSRLIGHRLKVRLLLRSANRASQVI